jgi:hypothetical protein
MVVGVGEPHTELIRALDADVRQEQPCSGVCIGSGATTAVRSMVLVLSCDDLAYIRNVFTP